MKEIFKDIEGFEGLYQISSMGRVKSLNYKGTGKEKIMKPQKKKNGYYFIGLRKRGSKKYCYHIHRLVGLMFIPNPNNYPCINHKDEQKQNNHIENLEWCTHKYNCNYGTHNEKLSKALKGKKPTQEQIDKMSKAHSIPIIQLTLNDEFVKQWDSARQAGRELNIHSTDITKCCKGKRKTYKGFKWRYVD